MTEAKPPDFYFDGIVFNTQYFKESNEPLTKDESDARYLIKTQPDTATALQSFSAGISATTVSATGAISGATVSATTVSATGDLSGATVTASGVITGATVECTTIKVNTYQSKSINQPLTLGNNQTSVDARMDIGCNVGRNANINIANTQTTGTANIIIGSTAISTGSQNIIINRPLTVGYDVMTLYDTTNRLGSFISGMSVEASIVNSITAATTLVNFTNIPAGIYIFEYQINYRINTSNAVMAQQKFILSTTANDFQASNIIEDQFTSLFKSNQETIVISSPTTDYTHKFSKTGVFVLSALTNVYLNYRILINPGTSVPYIIGSLRLVRIG